MHMNKEISDQIKLNQIKYWKPEDNISVCMRCKEKVHYRINRELI